MVDAISLQFTPCSTGIRVTATVTDTGYVLAEREVSAALMRHYVAEHADRHAAIQFDQAITLACARTEDEVPPSAIGDVMNAAQALIQAAS